LALPHDGGGYDGWSRICGCCVCGEKWKQRNMGCKMSFLQAVCNDCQRAKGCEGWVCGCGVESRGGVYSLLQPVSTRIYSDVLLLFGGEVRWDGEDERNERMSGFDGISG